LSVKEDCMAGGTVQYKRRSSIREIQITSKDPTETLDRKARRQDRHARHVSEGQKCMIEGTGRDIRHYNRGRQEIRHARQIGQEGQGSWTNRDE
jgi:hypothetical protein